MKQLTSTDFIAFFVIFGLIVFKLTGHNGSFDTAVAIIIGYYFGKRHIGMKEDVSKT